MQFAHQRLQEMLLQAAGTEGSSAKSGSTDETPLIVRAVFPGEQQQRQLQVSLLTTEKGSPRFFLIRLIDEDDSDESPSPNPVLSASSISSSSLAPCGMATTSTTYATANKPVPDECGTHSTVTTTATNARAVVPMKTLSFLAPRGIPSMATTTSATYANMHQACMNHYAVSSSGSDSDGLEPPQLSPSASTVSLNEYLMGSQFTMS